MFASAKEALGYIAEHDVAMVDLKVTGLAGQWLHLTVPARQFPERHFAEGVGYDGSSGAGFGSVEDGDVAALPDPTTSFQDPFFAQRTISFLCDTVTADAEEPHSSDPRTIAELALRIFVPPASPTKPLWLPNSNSTSLSA